MHANTIDICFAKATLIVAHTMTDNSITLVPHLKRFWNHNSATKPTIIITAHTFKLMLFAIT